LSRKWEHFQWDGSYVPESNITPQQTGTFSLVINGQGRETDRKKQEAERERKTPFHHEISQRWSIVKLSAFSFGCQFPPSFVEVLASARAANKTPRGPRKRHSEQRDVEVG
jgi:hypothetical protein